MTRARKVILGVVVAVAGAGGWYAWRVYFTLSHLPEAYAAWDVGTLLERYVETHEHRWPGSWEELLTVMDVDELARPRMRGVRGGETDGAYAGRLRETVAVNWRFDPRAAGQADPVTRLDGSKFPVLWQSADPNVMVRQALGRPTSGPATMP